MALFTALIFSAGAQAADVALTAVGQSPDAMMVRVVLKSLKVPADYDALLQPEGLEGQKILVAVVGGSSKGLGAAGIDKDQEAARAQTLYAKAAELGMKVLVMHVGGEGRRGTLSDLFISGSVPAADAVILVDGANSDGLFDKLTEPKKTPILTAPNVKSTAEPLRQILSEWGIQ